MTFLTLICKQLQLDGVGLQIATQRRITYKKVMELINVLSPYTETQLPRARDVTGTQSIQ